MKICELYDVFELRLDNMVSNNLVEYNSWFWHDDERKNVPVFQIGSKQYAVRFMPDKIGEWHYKIVMDDREIVDTFTCVENRKGNHGPVRTQGQKFLYEDGSRFIPFGTTCYAWTHQTEDLQAETLKTLENTCFNKIRMCVFPKSMPYNQNEPDLFPFEKDCDGKWDVKNITFDFFHRLEERIRQLRDLGVEADLILFHPYDRWGLSKLSHADSMIYVEYCVARLASYSNIWWSLANEYEMVRVKRESEWDAYGELINSIDPYGHLISIHQIVKMYPQRDWMSHCSLQTTGLHYIPQWKAEYKIPIVIDECGYEGDIEYSWGNISPFEMVNRFWISYLRGGFCTHGETYHRDDEVLWWAKGGNLFGKSEEKIAFLKELLMSLPDDGVILTEEEIKDPNGVVDKEHSEVEAYFTELFMEVTNDRYSDFIAAKPMVMAGKDFMLQYFGTSCQIIGHIQLPNEGKYRVELIDIWDMTRTEVCRSASGRTKISMPGKEGIAVLATRNYV